MTKSITFVVYQFTSPHAMPHLLPRYHYSKPQMLNAKIFYVPLQLYYTNPCAMPQCPTSYTTKALTICCHKKWFPRVVCDIRNLLVPSQRKIILLHETLISYLYCV